jgi:hypothetical protein
LIHFIPLTAAIALLVLNFSHQGLATSIDYQLPAALQFAAKLHELTMIASLTAVLLSFTCYYLAQNEGLPFGAAFASLQVLHRLQMPIIALLMAIGCTAVVHLLT